MDIALMKTLACCLREILAQRECKISYCQSLDRTAP